MTTKVKFGVFADLHVDIMHDTQERLEKFLAGSRAADVDFIIQLGDFCYPDEGRKCVCAPDKRPVNIENALRVKTYADKDKIISLYKNFEKPSYHCLGNHDCDMCSKKQILEYYGGDFTPYYSFDAGGIHFVVLDPNYYKKDGEYISYENGNYFDESYHKERVLPYLPPEQLEWLEEDLAKTDKPSVLFSHQNLAEDCAFSVLNAKDVKKILKAAPNGVLAAFNGHEHMDYAICQDDIWFVNINSMSCQWLDVDFIRYGCFTKEIDEKYPNIKYTAPYKDPAYAIVTIDEKGIDIKGTKSQFVGETPEERGLYKEGTWFVNAHGRELLSTPSIEDKFLPLKK